MATTNDLCGRCPHPPHLGACTHRNGRTALPCPCHFDTVPRSIPTGDLPDAAFAGRDVCGRPMRTGGRVWNTLACAEEQRCVEAPPRPVERCSCDEKIRGCERCGRLIPANRCRFCEECAALKEILLIAATSGRSPCIDEIERIARRALALGEEGP